MRKALFMPPGFTKRTSERCEDCDLRDDLTSDGRRRHQRRRSTRNRRDWGDLTFDAGWRTCETCGGKGRIPLEGLDQIDPYASKRR